MPGRKQSIRLGLAIWFGFVLLIGITVTLFLVKNVAARVDFAEKALIDFVLFLFGVSVRMKPGGSALNPYAAAYVPLSKREGYLGDSANPAATHNVQHQPYVAHGSGVQGKGSFSGSQMYMPKTTSSDMGYKQMRDEDLEMDMDMEFLLVTFSGLSHESINDVYLANNGDLDATIEMLNQLEIYSTESQEYLPDTLDIGDVPEIIEPSASSAQKQKNASTEASASSSTSSGTPNAPVSSS